MSVEGRLDRILASSLPHEVTHTVFAAYFGEPMPRWADEGRSAERGSTRTSALTTRLPRDLSFTTRRDAAGATLQVSKNIPTGLMGFYGQGYSISRFLIEMGGKPRFLKFVKLRFRNWCWDVATINALRLERCARARPRLALLAQGCRDEEGRQGWIDRPGAVAGTAVERISLRLATHQFFVGWVLTQRDRSSSSAGSRPSLHRILLLVGASVCDPSLNRSSRIVLYLGWRTAETIRPAPFRTR